MLEIPIDLFMGAAHCTAPTYGPLMSCADRSSCADLVCLATIVHAGCMCMEEHRPVCDTKNNITYGNQCEADCAGVWRPSNGACPNQRLSEKRSFVLTATNDCNV